MAHKREFDAVKDNSISQRDHPPANDDEHPHTLSAPSRIGDLPRPLGGELPTGVYVSVLAAFAWILFVAWLTFSGSDRTDLDLTIATIIFVMLLGIPLVVFGVASRHSRGTRISWEDFLSSTVDTASGPLPALQAWFGILVIPFALALAATLIAVTYAFVT